MANADGGEAKLFDKVGAARSAARTRPCLMGLPEGEGCAFTLTTEGVWLVQIPDVLMKDAAGHWPASVCAYLDMIIENGLQTFLRIAAKEDNEPKSTQINVATNV